MIETYFRKSPFFTVLCMWPLGRIFWAESKLYAQHSSDLGYPERLYKVLLIV
jgi:hypothetical protein